MPTRVALVKAYSEAQGMFRTTASPDPVFTDTLELDLTTVVPSLSGPKRPQDRVSLTRRRAEVRRSAQGSRRRPQGAHALPTDWREPVRR